MLLAGSTRLLPSNFPREKGEIGLSNSPSFLAKFQSLPVLLATNRLFQSTHSSNERFAQNRRRCESFLNGPLQPTRMILTLLLSVRYHSDIHTITLEIRLHSTKVNALPWFIVLAKSYFRKQGPCKSFVTIFQDLKLAFQM